MTHRFFVDVAPTDAALIEGDQARQIATVLRLGAGDAVILVADGMEHDVRLELAGYQRWDVAAHVAAGGENRVTASLER